MQELQKDEIELVNGGVAILAVVAVAAVVIAIGVGVYIGYNDAAAGSKAK